MVYRLVLGGTVFQMNVGVLSLVHTPLDGEERVGATTKLPVLTITLLEERAVAHVPLPCGCRASMNKSKVPFSVPAGIVIG
jgi:hypothetical protein